ncbi:MAG: hypothetical protein AB1671_14250 [Thermodesulfobacteriota bacterium]|jgi:hypothetical protein
MTAYIEGYRTGWASYLSKCKGIDAALAELLPQAQTLAEQAGRGLTDTQQRDFWLGYHHGRTAARAATVRRRARSL